MASEEDRKHNLPGRISRTSVARVDRQSLHSGAEDSLEHFDSNSLVGQSLFGEYLIKDVIGHGGMAVVYKALRLSDGKAVAVKTLKYADASLMRRFIREIEIHKDLKHPNIVEAIDFRTTVDGRAFFVMELLEGRSIEDMFATKTCFTKPERIAGIIFAVCDALSAAHAKGIIHRDIKPGNVIVSKQGESEKVSVVDFGLAKLYEDLQRITKTGQVLGSPVYMSPEQCLGEDLDPSSDVYSLAVVLYEMVTGELPYSAITPVSMMESHCNPSIFPKPVHEIVPDFPFALELNLILRKSMETEQVDRFQTVSEFKEAFSYWFNLCKGDGDDGYFESPEYQIYLDEGDSNSKSSSARGKAGKRNSSMPPNMVAKEQNPHGSHLARGIDGQSSSQLEMGDSIKLRDKTNGKPLTSELDNLVNKTREGEFKKRTEDLGIDGSSGFLSGLSKTQKYLVMALVFVVLVMVFAGATILLCVWYYKI